MRSNQWKQRKAQSAVQAARDCAEDLRKARGSVAQLLASFWEKGDGHYPPNFIYVATKIADCLTEEELKAFSVIRQRALNGNVYEWRREA